MGEESTIPPLHLFQDSSNQNKKKRKKIGILVCFQMFMEDLLYSSLFCPWGDPGSLHSFPAGIYPHPHPLESSCSTLSFFSHQGCSSCSSRLSPVNPQIIFGTGEPRIGPQTPNVASAARRRWIFRKLPPLPDFN